MVQFIEYYKSIATSSVVRSLKSMCFQFTQKSDVVLWRIWSTETIYIEKKVGFFGIINGKFTLPTLFAMSIFMTPEPYTQMKLFQTSYATSVITVNRDKEVLHR